MNKTPEQYREYILNLLLMTAGSWQATGCKDEAIEKRFENLLKEIHPDREIALLAFQIHIGGEVAA